jgi:hypothetical protein
MSSHYSFSVRINHNKTKLKDTVQLYSKIKNKKIFFWINLTIFFEKKITFYVYLIILLPSHHSSTVCNIGILNTTLVFQYWTILWNHTIKQTWPWWILLFTYTWSTGAEYCARNIYAIFPLMYRLDCLNNTGLGLM